MDGRRRLAFPNKKFLFGKRKVVASGPFIDIESGSLPRNERIGTNSGRVGAGFGKRCRVSSSLASVFGLADN